MQTQYSQLTSFTFHFIYNFYETNYVVFKFLISSHLMFWNLTASSRLYATEIWYKFCQLFKRNSQLNVNCNMLFCQEAPCEYIWLICTDIRDHQCHVSSRTNHKKWIYFWFVFEVSSQSEILHLLQGFSLTVNHIFIITLSL